MWIDHHLGGDCGSGGEEQGDQSGDHPGDPRERRRCLDQEGSWKEVRSGQNLDTFLEVKITRFTERLDMGCGKMSLVFGLSNCKEGFAID